MTACVYTDGSCLGNPGRGGFAAVGILCQDSEKPYFKISGGETFTTNNAMELKGVINGMEKAKQNGWSHFTLYTDSNYIVQGISKWVDNWVLNNWKTSTGKDVKNKDLWKRLYELKSPHIKIVWVKAHNGNKWNEVVDKLAKENAHLI